MTLKRLQDLSLKELFHKIDPSWYTPYLDTLPKKDHLLMLSAMQKDSHYHLSKPLSLFFLNHLFHRTFQKTPLPLSYLPEDKLAPLAFATFDELKRLIRLLALYDLLPELKKVLKATLLQKIEELLSKEERSYLQEIPGQKNQVHFGSIGLNHWDGNVEKLKEVLLERGMNRLSKAFALSSPDLVWYIEHTLDLPYAKKFTSLTTPMHDSRIALMLIEQVLTTWKKLCTPSH